MRTSEPAEALSGGAAVVAGRYRVQRLIARGGMGVVYLAEHIDLRRPVALKLLRAQPEGAHPADALADGEMTFQERFTLEARTLGALDHRNIVTLYDYGRAEDDLYFLAMEYIDGPRFTDLIAGGGRLLPERAVELLLQVCRALRYAHRRGVVHRDLKPSNLLIQQDDDGAEVVKVVDFGLVKVMEDDQTLTQAGAVLGSPHCMAPEQVKGEPVDHRADLYALGVLLFRAVSGQWPFHGDTSAATMIAHVNEPAPPLARAAAGVRLPPGLETIVARCLEKDPARRYPDAAALMQDLQGCIGSPVEEYRSASRVLHNSVLHNSVLHNSVSTTVSTMHAGPALPAPDASPGPLAAGRAAAPDGRRAGMLAVGVVLLGGLGIAAAVGLWLSQLQPEGRTLEAPAETAIAADPAPEIPADPAPNLAAVVPSPVPAAAEPAAAPPAPEPAAKPAPSPRSAPRSARPAAAGPPKEPAPGGPEAPSQPAAAAEKPADSAPSGYLGLPDDL